MFPLALSLLLEPRHWWDGPLGGVAGYLTIRLIADGYRCVVPYRTVEEAQKLRAHIAPQQRDQLRAVGLDETAAALQTLEERPRAVRVDEELVVDEADPELQRSAAVRRRRQR